MSELDLLHVVSATDAQVVALYGQFISISLAAVAVRRKPAGAFAPLTRNHGVGTPIAGSG